MNILFLSHRMPYPPNKGEKIRAWNILQHLRKRYGRVHLGCFVDDHADMLYAAELEKHVDSLKLIEFLDPSMRRMQSGLHSLQRGCSVTTSYFDHPEMHEWVKSIRCQENISFEYLFCSAMAQYMRSPQDIAVPVIMDMVDMDSQKWLDYSQYASGMMSWLYRREARHVYKTEMDAVKRADATIFVSHLEKNLFDKTVAPESFSNIHVIENGVDADYFSPEHTSPSPYAFEREHNIPVIVFTGAMDYWPNVQAAEWFVNKVLPIVTYNMSPVPAPHFYIVGSNPASSLRRISRFNKQVYVTGRVPDIRPWIQHADVVVAPMQIARGVQNKILEAMALGRPVVTTMKGYEGLAFINGEEIFAADTIPEMIWHLRCLLMQPALCHTAGNAARSAVVRQALWDNRLQNLDVLIHKLTQGQQARRAA